MGTVAFAIVKLLLCLLNPVYSQSSSDIPSQHEFCRETHVNLLEVGSRAHIKSEGYPNYVPDEGIQENDCFMYLRVCEECNMVIHSDEILMPRCNRPEPEQGSCIEGCDHLLFFEPDYPERTTRYIYERTGNWEYTSQTRNGFLKFCRATKQNADITFSFYIDVLDKTQTLTGAPGEVGYISSPFFPDKYNAYVGLDSYQYVIRNTAPGGRVKVTFTDWNLMPESYIEISYDEDKTSSIRRNGGEERPFVLSTNRRLYVDFYTGKEDPSYIPGLPYPGFRLEYQFLPDDSWPGRPVSSCGQYFKNAWGGYLEFKMSASQCSVRDIVDCIWVLSKQPNQDRFPKVELMFAELQLDDGDFMEIREGTVSTGSVVADTNSPGGIRQNHIYSDNEGFYVHLRVQCQWNKFVNATFISVVSKQRKWDCDDVLSGFWCNNWGRCINEELKCDGMDHCGNGQDESDCPATPGPCSRELQCKTGDESYCESQECDGFDDCTDGSDERGCDSSNSDGPQGSSSNVTTIIPAIVVPILLALVICGFLVYCTYKRMKDKPVQRREPHVQQDSVQRSSFVLSSPANQSGTAQSPFAIGGFMAYPEAPPSYEASQQHHINMAYMRSNSEEMLGKPPPYQPERGVTPPRSLRSTSQTNQNTPSANQSALSSPSGRSTYSMDASVSLTGAGALHPSFAGFIPNTTPNKRQSSVDVDHENEQNLNLEAAKHASDTKTPRKERHAATRAKKRLDLSDNQSTSQASGGAATFEFDNAAYCTSHADEEKHNVESTV